MNDNARQHTVINSAETFQKFLSIFRIFTIGETFWSHFIWQNYEKQCITGSQSNRKYSFMSASESFSWLPKNLANAFPLTFIFIYIRWILKSKAFLHTKH